VLVEQHEIQVGDQLAGLNYLLALPYVGTSNVFVYGWSYGGMQTILGAEANPGYKAAAAESWAGSPALRTKLVAAVAKIQIPVFLLQAQNDYSLQPNKALAAEFDRQAKPYRMRTYSPFGSGAVGADGHAFTGHVGFLLAGAMMWCPSSAAAARI
jgi:dienelactone hydrolase